MGRTRGTVQYLLMYEEYERKSISCKEMVANCQTRSMMHGQRREVRGQRGFCLLSECGRARESTLLLLPTVAEAGGP